MGDRHHGSRHAPAKTGSGAKFILLLWKNYILQKRHIWQTVLEIVIPVLLSGLLMTMRWAIELESITESTPFKPFPINPEIADLGFGA